MKSIKIILIILCIMGISYPVNATVNASVNIATSCNASTPLVISSGVISNINDTNSSSEAVVTGISAIPNNWFIMDCINPVSVNNVTLVNWYETGYADAGFTVVYFNSMSNSSNFGTVFGTSFSANTYAKNTSITNSTISARYWGLNRSGNFIGNSLGLGDFNIYKTSTPSTPILTATTGNFWVNTTWNEKLNANSYNISANGTWHNGTTNLYYNNSGLPHGWTNISMYAYNLTDNLLSPVAVLNTQIPNNPIIVSNISLLYLVNASQNISIYPVSTDVDYTDHSIFSSNATKGIFYTNNGTFIFNTTPLDIGFYNWYIAGTDNNGSTDKHNFVIGVLDINPINIASSCNASTPLGITVGVINNINDTNPFTSVAVKGSASNNFWFVMDCGRNVSIKRVELLGWYETRYADTSFSIRYSNTMLNGTNSGNQFGSLFSASTSPINTNTTNSTINARYWGFHRFGDFSNNEVVVVDFNIYPTLIPGIPNNLVANTSNFWVNYTWVAGVHTSSFNVSYNGTWFNGSSNTSINKSVGAHGWGNFSVCGYNLTDNVISECANLNTQVPNNIGSISNISNISVMVGKFISVYPIYTDIDNDSAIWSINITNGTFYTNNGTLLWDTTILDSGVHNISLIANDGWGGIINSTFTITIIGLVPTNLINNYKSAKTLSWVWDNPVSSNYSCTEIWIDSSYISCDNSVSKYLIDLDVNSTHTISLRVKDTLNNFYSWVNNTKTTLLSSVAPTISNNILDKIWFSPSLSQLITLSYNYSANVPIRYINTTIKTKDEGYFVRYINTTYTFSFNPVNKTLTSVWNGLSQNGLISPDDYYSFYQITLTDYDNNIVIYNNLGDIGIDTTSPNSFMAIEKERLYDTYGYKSKNYLNNDVFRINYGYFFGEINVTDIISINPITSGTTSGLAIKKVGYINITNNGTYTLSYTHDSDSSVWLYIDNSIVLNSNAGIESVNVYLTAGFHSIAWLYVHHDIPTTIINIPQLNSVNIVYVLPITGNNITLNSNDFNGSGVYTISYQLNLGSVNIVSNNASVNISGANLITICSRDNVNNSEDCIWLTNTGSSGSSGSSPGGGSGGGHSNITNQANNNTNINNNQTVLHQNSTNTTQLPSNVTGFWSIGNSTGYGYNYTPYYPSWSSWVAINWGSLIYTPNEVTNILPTVRLYTTAFNYSGLVYYVIKPSFYDNCYYLGWSSGNPYQCSYYVYNRTVSAGIFPNTYIDYYSLNKLIIDGSVFGYYGDKFEYKTASLYDVTHNHIQDARTLYAPFSQVYAQNANLSETISFYGYIQAWDESVSISNNIGDVRLKLYSPLNTYNSNNPQPLVDCDLGTIDYNGYRGKCQYTTNLYTDLTGVYTIILYSPVWDAILAETQINLNYGNINPSLYNAIKVQQFGLRTGYIRINGSVNGYINIVYNGNISISRDGYIS